jgi:hypothetical protein
MDNAAAKGRNVGTNVWIFALIGRINELLGA